MAKRDGRNLQTKKQPSPFWEGWRRRVVGRQAAKSLTWKEKSIHLTVTSAAGVKSGRARSSGFFWNEAKLY